MKNLAAQSSGLSKIVIINQTEAEVGGEQISFTSVGGELCQSDYIPFNISCAATYHILERSHINALNLLNYLLSGAISLEVLKRLSSTLNVCNGIVRLLSVWHHFHGHFVTDFGCTDCTSNCYAGILQGPSFKIDLLCLTQFLLCVKI